MANAIARTLIVVVTVVGNGCAATVGSVGREQQARVWVCHGNRNHKWQRVAAAAADAHRRHGDRVSTEAQEEGTACETFVPRQVSIGYGVITAQVMGGAVRQRGLAPAKGAP